MRRGGRKVGGGRREDSLLVVLEKRAVSPADRRGTETGSELWYDVNGGNSGEPSRGEAKRSRMGLTNVTAEVSNPFDPKRKKTLAFLVDSGGGIHGDSGGAAQGAGHCQHRRADVLSRRRIAYQTPHGRSAHHAERGIGHLRRALRRERRQHASWRDHAGKPRPDLRPDPAETHVPADAHCGREEILPLRARRPPFSLVAECAKHEDAMRMLRRRSAVREVPRPRMGNASAR